MVNKRGQEGNLGQGMKCLYNLARGDVMFKKNTERSYRTAEKMYLPIQMWNY